MEFRLASNGNVDGLREWLLAHPQRVNLPCAQSQYTLLFTAIKSGKIQIVAMLLREFNADPNIPCGGIGDTAVHAAAASGSKTILAAVLDKCVAMKPNYLGEYPIDVAESLAHNTKSLVHQQCVEMLRAYDAQNNRKDTPKLQPQYSKREGLPSHISRSTPVVGSPLRTAPWNSSEARETIRELRIDSDDSEKGNGDILRADRTPVKSSASQELPILRFEAKSEGKKEIVLRNERSVLDYLLFPSELSEFRRSFGNAFEYTETSHTLQARGLLPYEFKHVIYYTPVILIIDKDGTGGTPSRYRALLDEKNKENLFVNRTATYIDPYAGVIVPTLAHAKYDGFVQFIHEAIIKKFEHNPPLVLRKEGRKSLKENGSLFLRNLSERDVYLCVMHQLSLFCDDGFQYDVAKKKVFVFVPIFAIVKCPLHSTESIHSRSKDNNDANDSKEPLTVLSTELLMRIPVEIHFSPSGDFVETPRVYLINATNTTVEHRMNYVFLREIIADSSSGEVCRNSLTTLTEWHKHGSLCTVLKELQKNITKLLVDHVKSEYSEDQLRDSNQLSKGHKVDSGVTTGAGEDEMSDWLLVKCAPGSTPTVDSLTTNTSAQSRAKCERSKCVLCLSGEKTVLLMPCRHLSLCYTCSQLYKDRIKDVMLCPVCRDPIKEIIEVFL